MNKITLQRIAAAVGTLFFCAVAVYAITRAVTLGEQERIEKRAIIQEQAGFEIGPYDSFKCFNGWLLMRSDGRQAWMYPRDGSFNPIPCEAHDE